MTSRKSEHILIPRCRGTGSFPRKSFAVNALRKGRRMARLLIHVDRCGCKNTAERPMRQRSVNERHSKVRPGIERRYDTIFYAKNREDFPGS
jgi:hypothetical protein